MDESVLRNLDTQHRRLAELEADLARLLDGDVTVEPRATASTPQRYGELTAANDALRENRGWDAVDLDAALGEFDRWAALQRTPWVREDVIAVAVAGVVGAAATWFDSSIDAVAEGG